GRALNQESLHERLKRLEFGLDRPAALAEQILKLSDIYNAGQGSPRIWGERGLTAAYLAYFHPLNLLRLKAVLREATKTGFWTGIEEVIDFGAGLGTFRLALAAEKGLRLRKIIEVEAGPVDPLTTPMESAPWHLERQSDLPRLTNPARTVMVFSYSLNELA